MSDFTTYRAYCSACDREVTIGLLPDHVVVPGEQIDPGAIACHGVGEWCTGAMCPLFGVEPAEMHERKEKLSALDGRRP